MSNSCISLPFVAGLFQEHLYNIHFNFCMVLVVHSHMSCLFFVTDTTRIISECCVVQNNYVSVLIQPTIRSKTSCIVAVGNWVLSIRLSICCLFGTMSTFLMALSTWIMLRFLEDDHEIGYWLYIIPSTDIPHHYLVQHTLSKLTNDADCSILLTKLPTFGIRSSHVLQMLQFIIVIWHILNKLMICLPYCVFWKTTLTIRNFLIAWRPLM